MDVARLRDLLRTEVISLKDAGTHEKLPLLCKKLGLPSPGEGTKAERIAASFDSVSDADIPRVAGRFLEHHPPPQSKRNIFQDLIWADYEIEIPKKFRHEIARALEVDDLYLRVQGFEDLLDRLWVINDEDPFSFFLQADHSLRKEIHRHVYHNPGDWPTEYLFDRLGAFDASDRRFALFLEGLASSDVRPDEDAQRRFVKIVNETLRKCGIELRESDTDGGYPVFTVSSIHTSPRGRPKNLIFASPVKPDIRFRDAVNNDIEIVTNADRVLVYDRPINVEGLRWRDLQSWWMETNGISLEKAKPTLYRRLRDSLPQKSPPQSFLFDAFHRSFGNAIPELPALLPEVWLHWDPKTVRERGPSALLRFRMDFLLLLPNWVRVVLEVDGKHHYARSDGSADSARYATMVSADRELTLSGYQVFRFGADELQGGCGREIVKKFFEGLFKRYGVVVPLHPDGDSER